MAGSRQILVVDDEASARNLLSIMLERGGFQAIVAQDGPEALTILSQQPIDLIVLDLMLPGMSGIEICERLRKESATQNIPVLMLSARGDPQTVQNGLKAGANDYLFKPILL
jgi:two-component system phosphate regulon response regulator PhoB